MEKENRRRIEEEKQNDTKGVTDSRSALFTLIILSSTLLAVMFSETMLLPAIPEIMRDFNIPYSTSAWIFSAYLIVARSYDPDRRQAFRYLWKQKSVAYFTCIVCCRCSCRGIFQQYNFTASQQGNPGPRHGCGSRSL